jgi:ABC-type uncharacterized transport system ATPase subunit
MNLDLFSRQPVGVERQRFFGFVLGNSVSSSLKHGNLLILRGENAGKSILTLIPSDQK